MKKKAEQTQKRIFHRALGTVSTFGKWCYGNIRIVRQTLNNNENQ